MPQLVKMVGSATFGIEVEPSKQPWVLFFNADGVVPDGAEAFAESVVGQVPLPYARVTVIARPT